MDLTTHEKLLVTQTFYQIMSIAERASAKFYDRLFEIAPESKAMFATSDMAILKRKFIDMIAMVVYSLDSIEKIIGPIKQMGERHQAYGVSKLDYGKVREAFLWMLKTELASDYTEEVDLAWQTVYDWIFETATAGLYDEAS